MKRGVAPRPATERFAKKILKGDGCWLWTGARQAGGYGRFMVQSNPRILVLAHRYSYELARGPIADDLTLDHLCRNTSCVNPAHLEPVSRAVNSLRGSRNAVKTHCDYGHEFTPENTYTPPSRPNVRDCRTCRKASAYEQEGSRMTSYTPVRIHTALLLLPSPLPVNVAVVRR